MIGAILIGSSDEAPGQADDFMWDTEASWTGLICKKSGTFRGGCLCARTQTVQES